MKTSIAIKKKVPPNPVTPTTIKYIDLFCGLGAFHTAFNSKSNNTVNYQCVFACDNNIDVCNIYKENYGLQPEGDIYDVDIAMVPDFDILCAGFPCQPFSIAGKKKSFADATKGNLFYRILDFVDQKQPKLLFLENVKNLHTIDNGNTFKTICNEISDRGYTVNYEVIDSKKYGSPQSRQRIYIICTKNIQPYKFAKVNLPIVKVSSIIDRSIDKYFDYQTKYTLVPSEATGMMVYKLINIKTGKGGRQGERVYSIDTCGPTICASSGGPGAKTGFYEVEHLKIRTLSIEETLQMFGFPKTYKYSSLKNSQQMMFFLGNSIVVNVLERLIDNLPF